MGRGAEARPSDADLPPARRWKGAPMTDPGTVLLLSTLGLVGCAITLAVSGSLRAPRIRRRPSRARSPVPKAGRR